MKPAEIDALEHEIRQIVSSIGMVQVMQHAAERMQEKHITARDIELTLRFGQVIEIHNDAGELRVVVRHSYGKPKTATVVVMGLDTGSIVTAWKNGGDDNHKTLNLFAYQWKVNLVHLLNERSKHVQAV